MKMDRRDRRNAWLCAGSVLALMALTFPFAECGVNDDWSYTKTALDLANSGHLKYNGWAAAMVGAQAYWGAAFVKLFGFSFLATRVSTAPLAAGCAALLYALHRRSGLPPRLSLFGTMTIVLSPIFIPHAVSFMTEVPGFFLVLLSIYGYVRAAELQDQEPTRNPEINGSDPQASAGQIMTWLVLATVSGVLAGTVRQAFWLVPITALPYLLFRLRRPARHWILPLCLATLAFGTLAIIFGLALWFHKRPYAIHEPLMTGIRSITNRQTPFFLARQSSNIGLTLAALLLPLLIALTFAYVRAVRRRQFSVVASFLIMVLVGLLIIVRSRSDESSWMFPWLPNIFTITAYLNGTTPIPSDAVEINLSWSFWKAYSVLILCLACPAAALAGVTLLQGSRAKGPLLQALRRISPPLALYSIFAATYLPLLLLKSLVPSGAGLFDRYLLPIMPVATIAGFIVYWRATKEERLPLLAWIALGAMTYYGVAQTHDYFSLLRARCKLTNTLEARGIPRTKIMAGFEYDSWTQITVAGHYNDPRVENPAGQYIPPAPLSFETQYMFWQWTPVVHATYVVCLAPHRDLVTSDLKPAKYTAWLPPFRRECLVQVTDRSLASLPPLP